MGGEMRGSVKHSRKMLKINNYNLPQNKEKFKSLNTDQDLVVPRTG